MQRVRYSLYGTYPHHIINIVDERRLPKIDHDVFTWLLQTDSRKELSPDNIVESNTLKANC